MPEQRLFRFFEQHVGRKPEILRVHRELLISKPPRRQFRAPRFELERFYVEQIDELQSVHTHLIRVFDDGVLISERALIGRHRIHVLRRVHALLQKRRKLELQLEHRNVLQTHRARHLRHPKLIVAPALLHLLVQEQRMKNAHVLHRNVPIFFPNLKNRVLQTEPLRQIEQRFPRARTSRKPHRHIHERFIAARHERHHELVAQFYAVLLAEKAAAQLRERAEIEHLLGAERLRPRRIVIAQPQPV